MAAGARHRRQKNFAASVLKSFFAFAVLCWHRY
jgi:hypothetical protein